jgi:hypothetical protein
MRVRTMAMYGYKYIPFTWDELDKKAESCQRTVYELLGRYSGAAGSPAIELTVYEKELLRHALLWKDAFCVSDVSGWLQLEKEASLKVLRKLLGKELIRPLGKGTRRHHGYSLTEKAAYFFGK